MRISMNMRTVFSLLIALFLVSTLNITTSDAQDSPSVSVFEHPADVEITNFFWHWGAGYSPNSATFVTVTHKNRASGTIYLWDVATGTLRNTINHPTGSFFYDVDFSPDSTMIASASEDKKIYLWDVATHSLVKTLHGHTDRVTSVAFSPDEQTLASGSSDKTVRLWDVATGTLTDTIDDYSLDWPQFNVHVIFSPDGRILAIETYNAELHFWDVMNGSHLHSFTGDNKVDAWHLYHFAFSPDSTTFVSKLWDTRRSRTVLHNLDLRDVATGGRLQTFSAEHTYYPVFSPDGSKLAASGEGGIHLWDVATGALLNLFYPGFGDSDFSPNGRTLVTAGHANVYKAINVWDVATGEVINTLTLPEPHDYIGVREVQYSPDGTTIAAVKSFGDEQVVFLWRLAPTVTITFTPSTVADQMFEVGTPVNLTLPSATGGTAPYTYTLSPIPAGLQFDTTTQLLSGTPTTATPVALTTYTATDAAGASGSLTFTIEVIGDGPGPGTDPSDVNGDGQVTVIDLAIVALFYGTRVPAGVSLPADVNADGIVDLVDLTAVAQGIDAAGGGLNQLALWEVEAALFAAVEQAAELEAVAGAPMGFGTHVPSGGIVSKNIAAALADVKHLATGDVHLGKELAMLSELLQLLAEMTTTPETTALLANYPNPFNPETWIPYHLAKDAEVKLTIYDMRGVSVRELVLGHQAAGIYQSRGRAAYWDGKNHHGEPVASGVYFYTLTAGDFTATRKLLITK